MGAWPVVAIVQRGLRGPDARRAASTTCRAHGVTAARRRPAQRRSAGRGLLEAGPGRGPRRSGIGYRHQPSLGNPRRQPGRPSAGAIAAARARVQPIVDGPAAADGRSGSLVDVAAPDQVARAGRRAGPRERATGTAVSGRAARASTRASRWSRSRESAAVVHAGVLHAEDLGVLVGLEAAVDDLADEERVVAAARPPGGPRTRRRPAPGRGSARRSRRRGTGSR